MENSGVVNPLLVPVVVDDPKRATFVDPHFEDITIELRAPYRHPAEVLGNLLFPIMTTLTHPAIAITLRKVYLNRKAKNKRKRKHRKEYKRA